LGCDRYTKGRCVLAGGSQDCGAILRGQILDGGGAEGDGSGASGQDDFDVGDADEGEGTQFGGGSELRFD
jgi:hypothetical protein